METEKEVKVIQVDLKCPDCDFKMERSLPNSGIYMYVCFRCSYSMKSEKKYPYNKYIHINN